MSDNASATLERDLLACVLALRAELITVDDLRSVLDAEPSRPPVEALQNRGCLAAGMIAPLERLAQAQLGCGGASAWLDLLAGDADLRERVRGRLTSQTFASLASPPTRPPDSLMAPATRAPDEPVTASSVVSTTPAAPALLDSPPTRGFVDAAQAIPTSYSRQVAPCRYRRGRLHAQGGLGVVYQARDEELGRTVALKEIQDRHADHSTSRARFVFEAEVTGNLEHPGIVPVYGLGHYPDGRPYYAMRFIRGGSLEEAIRRFHEAERAGRDPSERTLALRGLLRRFVDARNAVGYAHSRGVIHRDLKPANVMLGEFGETLVVDWGMARLRHKGRAEESESVQPASAGTLLATQQGAAVGTPAYMPPEQALGQHSRVSPASDTYSLGATLYHLLTGQVSITARSLEEVVEKVVRGDYPPARQANPAVPASLEAVCKKAMAVEPGQRYESPRALAEEVERWLADEPVQAYGEPLPERLRRWGRRHRGGVTAAVAALLVAVVGLVAATALLGAANDRERTARELAQQNEEEAKKQRDKARDRFKLAREAVDRFHTQVSESPEMKARGVEKLRTKLLETAADFYQKFVQEEEGDDREVRAERARGYVRLGKLYKDTGRNNEAEQAFLKGLDISRQLGDGHSQAADSRSDLADGLIALGLLYHVTGRIDRGEKLLSEARDTCQKLIEAHPADLRYRRLLAEACRELGHVYRSEGRFALAEEIFLRGVTLREQVVAQSKEPEDSRSLGAMLGSLGRIYSLTGRLDLFEKTQQRAVAIHQALVDAHPEEQACWEDLGYGHNNLGNLYRSTSRYDLAEKSLRQALAWRGKLAAAHPAAVNYHSQLAVSHLNLAILYRVSNRFELAEKSCQQALALYKKLADDHPDLAWNQRDLIGACLELGELYRTTGRLEDAERAYREALASSERLVAAHPKVLDYVNLLAASHHNLGLAFSDGKRHALAAKAYERAIAVRAPLAAADSSPRWFQNNLAWSHRNLGTVCLQMGKRDEALKEYRQASDLWSKLVKEHPDDQWYPGNLAHVCYDMARIQASLAAASGGDASRPLPEREKNTETWVREALALLERARQGGYFKNPQAIVHLKTDGDLAFLRSRDDFRVWLKRLEAGKNGS